MFLTCTSLPNLTHIMVKGEEATPSTPPSPPPPRGGEGEKPAFNDTASIGTDDKLSMDDLSHQLEQMRVQLLTIPGATIEVVDDLLDLSNQPKPEWPEEMDPDHPVWRLMRDADKKRDPRAMAMSIVHWWGTFPALTLSHLERAFRANEFRTSLVAVPREGCKGVAPDGAPRTYVMFMAVDGPVEALCEMAHQNITLEENLKRLEDCGVVDTSTPLEEGGKVDEAATKGMINLGAVGFCKQCGYGPLDKKIICHRCKMAEYCNTDCRKRNKKEHRKICRERLKLETVVQSHLTDTVMSAEAFKKTRPKKTKLSYLVSLSSPPTPPPPPPPPQPKKK